MGGLGKWAEDAWNSGKKAVGETVEGTAHIAGAGLDMVGLHGAAKTVDGWGDSAADELGADIPERELGQTDDPNELIHGDPVAIREAAGHLRKFQGAFDSTGSGLSRLDHDHWKGAAAEAFRKKFTPHPKQWLTAGAACEKAADALNTYAHTVEWAQQQAKECAEQYRSNSEAYDRAQNAYNKQVDTYNADAQRYNEAAAAGRDPGAKPVQPGKFDGDHYLTQMSLAEGKLHQARVQRDDAARTAGTAIDAATATAPAEPSFTTRLLDDGEDLFAGAQVARFHIGGGLIKGAADMVKFVRGLNPEDPYNITHPSMWLDHVSTTAAGMVHSGMHPNQLVSAVVGSGWGSDPGEALGKLTINLAAGTLTDGGSVEGSVAERETVGVAENAAKNDVLDVTEQGAVHEGALPDDWTIDPTTADKEAHHDWSHLGRSVDGVSAKIFHHGRTDVEAQLKFEKDQYPWLENVNGGKGAGYDINCSQNVEAVNGRLDGHDSVADPLLKAKWPDPAKLGNPHARWENAGSYEKIIQDMDKRGEGARGVVYISRRNGTAHVFNVIHDRNGIVFLDGQSGHLARLEKNVKTIGYMPYR